MDLKIALIHMSQRSMESDDARFILISVDEIDEEDILEKLTECGAMNQESEFDADTIYQALETSAHTPVDISNETTLAVMASADLSDDAVRKALTDLYMERHVANFGSKYTDMR